MNSAEQSQKGFPDITSGIYFRDEDSDALHVKIRAIMGHNGVQFGDKTIPLSGVIDGSSVVGSYWLQDTGGVIVLIAAMDSSTVLCGEELEVCGFRWLLWEKAAGTLHEGEFVTDFYHAFGKHRARVAIRKSLEKVGIIDDEVIFKPFFEEISRNGLRDAIAAIESLEYTT